ncbi:MAG: hypothetical protein AAB482_01580 [Patescibacteria group bacterium]
MQSLKVLPINAFALVEVLVTSALLTMLAGFGIVIGTDGYKNYLFHSEEQTLLATLNTARSHALNNIYEMPHGVHIEPSAYIIFRGSIYTAGAATNESISRNTAIATSGISEVVFTQLAGDANIPGSITLNDGIRSRTITINNEGTIHW